MYESTSCPKCQGPRDAKALYCPFCGAVFERTIMAPPAASHPEAPEPEPILRAAVDPYRPPAADSDLYDAERPTAIASYREPHQTLASLGSRLGAYILDSMFLGFSFFVVFILLLVVGVRPLEGVELGADVGSVPMSALMMVFVSFVPVGLVNIYYLARDGQTLGKKALKIKIVRETGEPVAVLRLLLLRSVVPWFLEMVPILGFFFGLFDALFIFRADRRCIHDHIADTIVVDV